MELIGISGYAVSGKDTVAEYYTENCRFARYAFADTIKKTAAEMFGVPLEHFYDREFKEVVIPFWGYSPRYMAQIIGTECGRNLFRKDIWIKRAEVEYNKYRDNFNAGGMVIPDIRYENEAEWIQKMGGIIIHVTRPGYNGDVGTAGHDSEAGYPDNLKDYTVVNDGTIAELHEKIKHIAVALA